MKNLKYIEDKLSQEIDKLTRINSKLLAKHRKTKSDCSSSFEIQENDRIIEELVKKWKNIKWDIAFKNLTISK